MRKCFFTLVMALTVMILPMAAVAAESDRMPDMDDSEKSLTIYFYVQNNGTDVPISGAEIAIYKIADLNCENGSAEYTLLPQYNSLAKYKNGKDVTFDGITVTQSTLLSKEISELVTDADAVGITDDFGEYTFTSLSQGMYLVQEVNAYGDADDYEIISPYIISVPLPVKDSSGNSWKYDVLSEPKTAIETKNNGDSIPTLSSSVSSAAQSYSSGVSGTEVSSRNRDDSSSTSSVSSSASSSSSNPGNIFDDVSKVITGYISHVILFFMILFGSAFFILLTVGKKKGEDNDEKN